MRLHFHYIQANNIIRPKTIIKVKRKIESITILLEINFSQLFIEVNCIFAGKIQILVFKKIEFDFQFLLYINMILMHMRMLQTDDSFNNAKFVQNKQYKIM